MWMMRSIAIGFGLLLAMGSGFSQASHPTCDSRYVEDAGTKIVVLPSGPIASDAQNLECAFKVATHLNKPKVELTQGTYRLLSRVSADNFDGTLTGHTIATTIVAGCSGTRGGIVFNGGSPAITRMTFDSQGSNCANHLTVTSAPDSCGKNSSVFVKLDRLLFQSDKYGDDSAVIVEPQKECIGPGFSPAPETKLLGKLLINRVDMVGSFDVGGKISMSAGAQVDVFFSSLVGRDAGLLFLNTGTNAQIVGSTVESTLVNSYAILIEDAPGIRRSSNVLNVSNSVVVGYGDAIAQDCSVNCIVNISDSEVRSSFGSPFTTSRTGSLRVFGSDIRGADSILLVNNSVMANNDIYISAIPDIRVLGGGNTINQPRNDVKAPMGADNFISSRN